MNIKTRPLFIAAGISFGVQLIFTLLSTLPMLFLQLNPAMLEKFLGFGDGMPEPNGALIGGFMGLGVLACLCPFVLDGIAGAVYAVLHNRIEAIELQDGILGGAASGALGRITATVVSTGISLLMMPLMMNQMMSEFGSPAAGGLPPGGFPAEVMATMVVGSFVSAIFGIIVGAISGAVMGSIGGGITAVILENNG